MNDNQQTNKELIDNLLGSHFHQDWDYDFATEKDVIFNFCKVKDDIELMADFSKYLTEKILLGDNELLVFLDKDCIEYEQHQNARQRYERDGLSDEDFVKDCLPEERKYLTFIRDTVDEYLIDPDTASSSITKVTYDKQ